MMGAAAKSPVVAGVQPNELPPAPQLNLSLDREQAQSMGLAISDVYTAVQLMLAPVFVNDFIFEGRVLRVTMQADAPYRMNEELCSFLSTGGRHGASVSLLRVTPRWMAWCRCRRCCVPTGSWTPSGALQWISGHPDVAARNRRSSGEAMRKWNASCARTCPGLGTTGASPAGAALGAEAPMLLRCPSGRVPVPGRVIAAGPHPLPCCSWCRRHHRVGVCAKATGLPNDVFFKVGLITIIGLAAKNAILIVEFAIEEQKRGTALYESIMEAARLRLRPILMTSFAFILGVTPLVFATGAGANARRALGTGVVGGMLSAAILGVLLAPIFFVPSGAWWVEARHSRRGSSKAYGPKLNVSKR
jgi:multidrug efflux pump